MIYGANAYGQTEYGGLTDFAIKVSVFDSVGVSEEFSTFFVNWVLSVFENITVAEGTPGTVFLLDNFNSYDATGYPLFYVATAVTVGQDVILNSGSMRLAAYGATGNLYAQIYLRDINNKPTGEPLAISDVVDASTISSAAYHTFTFSGANKIVLDHTQNYCLALYYDNGISYRLSYELGPNNSNHPGYSSSSNGTSWSYYGAGSASLSFNLYGENPSGVVMRVTSYINPYEEITVSDEDEDTIPVLYIDVNDTVTVSDEEEPVIPILFVDEHETVSVYDSPSVFIPYFVIAPYESITISEDIAIKTNTYISVYDDVGVADVIDLYIPILHITTWENIAVTEDFVPLIPILYITEDELVSVLDVPHIEEVSHVGVSDTITVTEYVAAETALRGVIYPYPTGGTFSPFDIAPIGTYGSI